MKEIRIDVGVYTMLTVNLSKMDFTGIEKIILTVKNLADPKAPVIIEREFTEAKVHEVLIKPEESIQLTEHAKYDFDKVVDGKRLKLTDVGNVVLQRGVGDCIE